MRNNSKFELDQIHRCPDHLRDDPARLKAIFVPIAQRICLLMGRLRRGEPEADIVASQKISKGGVAFKINGQQKRLTICHLYEERESGDPIPMKYYLYR